MYTLLRSRFEPGSERYRQKVQGYEGDPGNNFWNLQAGEVFTKKGAAIQRHQRWDSSWLPWYKSPLPNVLDSLSWIHVEHYLELQCSHGVVESGSRYSKGARNNRSNSWSWKPDVIFRVSFFELVLGEMLLHHTDYLSWTLQKEHISAAEGQSVAAMTTTTPASTRNDKCFNSFWQKVTVMGLERDVDEPRLPWQRKRPRQYQEGNALPSSICLPKTCTVGCTLSLLIYSPRPSPIVLISPVTECIDV